MSPARNRRVFRVAVPLGGVVRRAHGDTAHVESETIGAKERVQYPLALSGRQLAQRLPAEFVKTTAKPRPSFGKFPRPSH